MKMERLINQIILFVLVLTCSPAFALSDVAGGADHPEIPRVKGSVLVAYSQADFAEGAFFVENEKKRLIDRFEEGKSTNLVYLLEEGQVPYFAVRNYQEAFSKLGEVTDIYSCKSGQCDRYLGKNFVWSKIKSRRIQTEFPALRRLYDAVGFYDEQVYWFATIKSDKASYAVSVYSAVRSPTSNAKIEGMSKGQALVHVQIIENAEFESDLVFVKASDIQKGIATSGHVALYGLFFNTGNDQLTAESSPALAEVAKALNESPELTLYVVGHTDNVGSIDSNQDLSARRARSVVASLVNDYEISSERLLPIGVGLAAPVTTNTTQEGRARNRRVELVER